MNKFFVLIMAAIISMAVFSACNKDNEPVPTPPVSASQPLTTPSATPPTKTLEPTPSIEVVVTPSPTASPENTVAPVETVNPFVENPIDTFYGNYMDESYALLNEYSWALQGLNTADGVSYSILLSKHQAALSELERTINLVSANGDTHKITSGETSGSGVVTALDNGYSFNFQYITTGAGKRLYGSFLNGNELDFTVVVLDGTGAVLRCTLQYTKNHWVSTVYSEEAITELAVPHYEGASVVDISFGAGKISNVPYGEMY